MFSSRLPRHLEPNSLARALARARAAGKALIDLTVTNPTQVGIRYPADLFESLSKPEAARYVPEPFGSRTAREAVARDYQRRSVEVAWDRIVLTSSTSEAYSLLFKLLCAPTGDAVLVPAPSYPLFEHLTRLDGVTARTYYLDYHGRWLVDFDTVDAAWDASTRAALAVNPNNPTGSLLTRAELQGLADRCAERKTALILDEVFADYTIEAHQPGPPVPAAALTFRLGGLSKSAALPQIKLGWIAVAGPDALVASALEHLEWICDTYLSVSTPVQIAAAELIAGGSSARAQVLDRVRSNYEMLRRAAAAHPAVDVLNVEAGWSAVLRVPSRSAEEDLVLDLLERDGIIVHPGFFFDFPHEAYLIVSLLPDPEQFRAGVRTLLERMDA